LAVTLPREREVGADFGLLEGDAEHAAVLPHRMRGVRAEIEQHLVNLRRIAEDRAAVRRALHLDRDVGRQRRAQEAARLLDDHREIDRAVLGTAAMAPEGENLLDELPRAEAGVARLVEAHPRRVILGQRIGRELVIANDAGEEIVEIVRDPAGERAEGFHFLGLEELRLQLVPGGFALVLRRYVLDRAVHAADHPQAPTARSEELHLDVERRRGGRDLVERRLHHRERLGREKVPDVFHRGLERRIHFVNAPRADGPRHPRAGEIDFPATDLGEPADLARELLGFPQPLLELFAWRDVGMGACHPQRPAVGVAADDLAAIEHPAPGAVFRADAQLLLIEGGPILEVFLHCRLVDAEIVGVNEAPPLRFGILQLVRPVAEHARPALVVVNLAADEIPIPHRVVGTFERELPALLGEIEGLGELLLLRHVATQPDDAQRLAARIALQVTVGIDVPRGPIRTHDAKCDRVVGQLARNHAPHVLLGVAAVLRMYALEPGETLRIEVFAPDPEHLEHAVVPVALSGADVELPDAVVRGA
jgi:hypothetical protein